jgi:hypothetical protein
LNQFGADPKKIKDYAEAINNLAALMDTTIPNATEVFIHAMEGNFSMLSRYGIHVREAGTQLEKMHDLMTQVAVGAPVAAAATQTTAGAWQKFQNAAGEATTAVGNLIGANTLLKNTFQVLTYMFDDFATIMGKVPKEMDDIHNADKQYIKDMEALIDLQRKYKNALEDVKIELDQIAQLRNQQTSKREQMLRLEDEEFKKTQAAQHAQYELAHQRHMITDETMLSLETRQKEQAIVHNLDIAQRRLTTGVIAKKDVYDVAQQNLQDQLKLYDELKKKRDALVGQRGATDALAKAEQDMRELAERIKTTLGPAATKAWSDFQEAEKAAVRESVSLHKQAMAELDALRKEAIAKDEKLQAEAARKAIQEHKPRERDLMYVPPNLRYLFGRGETELKPTLQYTPEVRVEPERPPVEGERDVNAEAAAAKKELDDLYEQLKKYGQAAPEFGPGSNIEEKIKVMRGMIEQHESFGVAPEGEPQSHEEAETWEGEQRTQEQIKRLQSATEGGLFTQNINDAAKALQESTKLLKDMAEQQRSMMEDLLAQTDDLESRSRIREVA